MTAVRIASPGGREIKACLAYCEAPKPNSQPPEIGDVSVPGIRHEMLTHFEFLDRQSRNFGRSKDLRLRDLDDLACDHFRERVVAILDAKRMERLLVSCRDAADHSRLQIGGL